MAEFSGPQNGKGPDPVKITLQRKAELKAKGKFIPPEQYASLIRDPAIERWGSMREKTQDHFKFRPRTIFLGVMWCAVVPAAYYFFLKWENKQKHFMTGKTPQEHLGEQAST
ncbi:hypothetical protein AC249_AIPGENE15807 [Paramuricea clavata]|uniref:NADH dehydrogenase [ubiquinone] 1 beta subcomplex subunit 4 n=1 Tax=Paramuricea clavata TaxID=317549 RepID=A0A6S7FNT4_PARCT|nr:hypothetical protein AC249_AIPGENE15807 [Paramuricea clavata]